MSYKIISKNNKLYACYNDLDYYQVSNQAYEAEGEWNGIARKLLPFHKKAEYLNKISTFKRTDFKQKEIIKIKKFISLLFKSKEKLFKEGEVSLNFFFIFEKYKQVSVNLTISHYCKYIKVSYSGGYSFDERRYSQGYNDEILVTLSFPISVKISGKGWRRKMITKLIKDRESPQNKELFLKLRKDMIKKEKNKYLLQKEEKKRVKKERILLKENTPTSLAEYHNISLIQYFQEELRGCYGIVNSVGDALISYKDLAQKLNAKSIEEKRALTKALLEEDIKL